MSKRDYNDFDDRHEMNAIERDRMERRRQIRRKSIITNALVIGVIAIVIIGIIIAVVNLTKNNKTDKETEPTAVTATIVPETQQATQTVPTATTPQPQSAEQIQQNAQSGVQTSSQQSEEQNGDEDDDESNDAYSQAANNGSAHREGSELHYTANGKTTRGYDYTYNYDPSYVSISCDYDFSTNQYDFSIQGVSEGTTTLTLYYDLDDNTTVPVNMTVYVDSDLNVSRVG